jgi:glucose/arabinose dehydrogenase
MRRIRLIKLVVIFLFVALGAFTLFTDDFGSRKAYAKSTGPDVGHTGAPNEKTCDECHVPDAGSVPPGQLLIGAPQSYVPGQTYQLSVSETNASPTRQRWGFQLTAIDDNGDRAGTLQAGGDGRTQVLTGGFAPNPSRQYIEHTQTGTFVGQSNGATWTFNWTAPATDAGPVTFYSAGNQANNDNNSSGDSISTIFVVVPSAAGASDFAITVSPSSQIILPGGSNTFTVTVTPSNGFTGAVNLSATGLPAGVSASFNPATVNITDANPRTSTLTLTTSTTTPLGNFAVTATGTSGALSHGGSLSLITGPTMTDANLTVRQVVSGLFQPTSMAFLGDEDFLVLERPTGKVWRVTHGVKQATPVLDLAVNNFDERGLLGIALHPQFPSNPRVYLYWTESTTGADSPNADETPLLGNRVDSFLWNGSALSLERNLIHLRALQQDAGQSARGTHNGGVLRFGPDGKLYIFMGDNGRRGMMQNLRFGPSASPSGPTVADDQFGGPEPDNAHLTGVILRLNDDGTTPTDNPFFNANSGLTGEAAANVKKVFSYGSRNSFGMAFDPASGYLWTEENGDDSFDEINRVVPGFNGGWIQLMGPSARIGQFKQIELTFAGGLQQDRWTPDRIADTSQDALSRLYVLPGSSYTEPVFSWKYAVAPSPVGFVRGGGLGPSFAGDLLVGGSRTTLAGGYLFRFKLTSDRRDFNFAAVPALADHVADNSNKFDPTESETLLVGRDFGITTDIESAPNGNVYVVSLSNGAVYEISSKPNTVQFASSIFQTSEDHTENTPRAIITVTRAGDTSGTASVDYRTVDDNTPVRCDAVNGTAYARCDYATTTGTLTFAPGETQQTFTIPIIEDAYVEGSETLALALFNPSGATLGAQATATLNIADNDVPGEPNPIYRTDFFVRQQYLDFLSREPEPGEPWSAVLNNCPDPFNTSASSPSATCDRVSVSTGFFRSPEFEFKGRFIFNLYKSSLGRLPLYAEFVVDMANVTAGTTAEVQAKKAAFVSAFVGRQEFKNTYDAMTNTQFVNTLMDRYGLPSIRTPNPATPDDSSDAAKVTLTRADLINQLTQQTLTRAQVVRAVADSNEVSSREFNSAFVTMQYFGYLRRDPETGGYNDWLRTINANPNDIRSMVLGFLNSPEYAARFGVPR